MPVRERVQDEETKQGRVEFSFPLLIVRVKAFMRVYDRLGASGASRLVSWTAIIGMPIAAGFGLFFIFNSLLILLISPAAREVGRELGPQAYVLLPGINPYLPIFYGWLAIVVAMMVHEGAHGVIAKSLGLRVKSSGFLFLLVLPVGAFVDVDEEQLAKAKLKNSVRVFAAGPGANIALAIICILGVLIITSGLTPVVDGVYIFDVLEGMPAEKAGLLPNDVIISVDGIPIANFTEFNATLVDKRPNDTMRITVARGKMWKDQFSTSARLIEYEGEAFLGVSVGEILTEQRLRTYQTLATEAFYIHFIPPTLASGLVPFSGALNAFYTHTLGENWHIPANIFFWLWFVNVNIAIFNALPIYPFDGGRTFKTVLKAFLGRRAGDKTVSQLTNAVTVILVSIIVMIVVLPFIM